MKQLILSAAILFSLLFITSCKGPNTAELPDENMSASIGGCDQMGPVQFINVHGNNYEYRSNKPIQIAEYIRRIFKDSTGNLWFGTNAYGVCRYDGDTLVYFSTWDGLAGHQVTGIIEDQRGNLWFSTNGGVSMYDGNIFTNFTDKEGLSSNSVWSIFEDSNGIIWAGTINGLCKYNPNDGAKFIGFSIPQPNVSDPNAKFSTSMVSFIMEDKNGNLWFGTDGLGACKYDGKTFSHFTKSDGLCDNSIVSMLEDKNGDIWFSSRFGGLGKYDGRTFTNFNTANSSIGNDEVWTIYEDKAGNIWFSSEGFGIYRYDGKSIVNFSKEEGLPIQAVQSIYQDDQGLLWIGGGNGLYLFDGQRFSQVTRKGPWGGC